MDTEHLREFIVIVDEGSITRAAARLHCSQPMLSKHVSALEHELGCTLLERKAGGVEATREGRLLYGQGARIVQAVAKIRSGTSGKVAKAKADGADAVDALKVAELAERHELSRQEAQCLAQYLAGEGLEAVAERMGLTRDEAARVLGGVYRKTKTRGKERLGQLAEAADQSE